ncbi:MAG: hypothetical protein ACTSVL_01960 [Promethearchaeota archaeon]
MNQINFRLSKDEYDIVKLMAKLSNHSIPALIKDLTKSEIKKRGKKMALELYKQNKIGFKTAWKISQLSFHEFTHFLVNNGIEPHISEDLDKKMVNIADNLNFNDIFIEKNKDILKNLI